MYGDLRIVWLSATCWAYSRQEGYAMKNLSFPKGIRLWQDTGFVVHNPDDI